MGVSKFGILAKLFRNIKENMRRSDFRRDNTGNKNYLIFQFPLLLFVPILNEEFMNPIYIS